MRFQREEDGRTKHRQPTNNLFEEADFVRKSRVEKKSEKKRQKQTFQQRIKSGDWDFDDEDEFY